MTVIGVEGLPTGQILFELLLQLSCPHGLAVGLDCFPFLLFLRIGLMQSFFEESDFFGLKTTGLHSLQKSLPLGRSIFFGKIGPKLGSRGYLAAGNYLLSL